MVAYSTFLLVASFLAVSMVSLNMMIVASALKLISFFLVVNDVNDYLETIRIKRVTIDNKRQYFTQDQISDHNLDILLKKQDILHIINLKDYILYIFMPTLSFQLSYPRSPRIRIWWLLKRILEFTVSMMLFL